MVVVPSARREGDGDIWLDGLLRHLPELGISPVVVFERHGELAEMASGYGCRPIMMTEAGGDQVATLANLLRAHRPDVTVFWSPRAQVYGSRAHRPENLDAPHGSSTSYRAASGCTGRRRLSRPTSCSVSRRLSSVGSGSFTRCARPVFCIRGQTCAMACRGGRRESGSVCTARVQLGGVVGRIEPWKGQDVAVRMLAELVTRRLDVHLVLLGERRSPTWPEFGAEVAARARNHGLDDRVVFTGHVRDVPAVLPTLDVLVCASREEGFGLAAVEAMAAGVPVVSARRGGPKDVIEHGLTGLLVPVEDPLRLAEAVERLLADRNFAVGLADRARKAWRMRFTARRSTEAFSPRSPAWRRGLIRPRRSLARCPVIDRLLDIGGRDRREPVRAVAEVAQPALVG